MFAEENIDFLWHVQTWQFDFQTFKEIYGDEDLAKHMWKKYTTDFNLLRFWRQNDTGNKNKIIKYLNSEKCKKEFILGMLL